MGLIFKRFANTLTICISVVLIFAVGNYIRDNAYNELDQPFGIATLCYAVVFAINYIFLGVATLWHKNVSKKI
ncbi:hypothetical protein MCEMSEM29_01943 [Methylophilaceae bacterium]